MQCSSVINVAAHGPVAVVDAEDDGVEAGARGVDGGEDILVAHKAMAPEADIPLDFTGSRRFAASGSRCPDAAGASTAGAVGCAVTHMGTALARASTVNTTEGAMAASRRRRPMVRSPKAIVASFLSWTGENMTISVPMGRIEVLVSLGGVIERATRMRPTIWIAGSWFTRPPAGASTGRVGCTGAAPVCTADGAVPAGANRGGPFQRCGNSARGGSRA